MMQTKATQAYDGGGMAASLYEGKGSQTEHVMAIEVVIGQHISPK